jgi:hypothetical protein
MTLENDPRDPNANAEEAGETSDADDPMRALLKRSMGTTVGDPAPPKDLLRGVQTRIRKRSRGKFYGDGWSTSSSRVSYMLVATAMLVVIAVAYFALGPMGVSAH